MAGGDPGLQMKTRDFVTGPGAGQLLHSLRDNAAIPGGPILLLQKENFAVGISPGGEARRLQIKEREQRVRPRFVAGRVLLQGAR